MKWLFVLLLALIIFGGAAWFGYNTFVKEEIAVKKEQRGEVTPAPVPDISLPEFQAAAQLRQDGKLTEARDALIAFIQKYPNGKHLEEAKDLIGEANVAILLSRYPSPEKTEYVVKSGDVLAKIAILPGATGKSRRSDGSGIASFQGANLGPRLPRQDRFQWWRLIPRARFFL